LVGGTLLQKAAKLKEVPVSAESNSYIFLDYDTTIGVNLSIALSEEVSFIDA